MPKSPLDALIDAATGYKEPERPRDPTPEQIEAAKLLASDVLSDLRFYYPDVVKTRPTTWPIHLRNTIASKVARLLVDRSRGPMPEPGFTVAETEAFDQGVRDGVKIGRKPKCPYRDEACADAWETGYSAGDCSS